MAMSERGKAAYRRQTEERRKRRTEGWQRDRDAHLVAVNYRCEIGPMLAAAGDLAYRYCTGHAGTCHHALARGMGGSLNNDVIFATCPHCHQYVEDHPEAAKAIGAKVLHDY